MNALKQRWKDFIVWFIENKGYSNLHIEKWDLRFTTYYPNNRRHDVDNSCPKFILDGLCESCLFYTYLYGEKYGMGIVLAGGNAGIGRYEIAW